jgi:hypothetical protein
MGFGVAAPQKMKHKSCAKGADCIFKTKIVAENNVVPQILK